MASRRSSRVEAAVRIIQGKTLHQPSVAVVLGSGFGRIATLPEFGMSIDYAKIPGFPIGNVAGHAGRLLIGGLRGVHVAVLCGRAHFYEGFEMAEVTFPIRVLAALGVKTLLLTNAAGGINRRFRTGEFMTFTDHINFMGINPLRVARGRFGSKPTREPIDFPDLSAVYDDGLQRELAASARSAGARMHRGVYLAVSGPTYETPAEIRAFRRLGADAVGMSTVPEAIVACACGMRVAGLSCITNPAAGLGGRGRSLSHREVLDAAASVEKTAGRLVEEFVGRVGPA